MAVVYAGESGGISRSATGGSAYMAAAFPDWHRRQRARGDIILDDCGTASSWRHPVTGSAARLTSGQRDCLRLVFQHLTSKDIARTLGISPHTVDMRLRTAMRTLGVASRIDAARLLIAEEGEKTGPSAYQPLIYQPPEIAAAPLSTTMASPVQTSTADDLRQLSSTWSDPDVDSDTGGPPRPVEDHRYGEGRYAAPLANSLPWGRRNSLTPGARLAWIAAIAIGSALGFGAILAALEALKHLL